MMIVMTILKIMKMIVATTPQKNSTVLNKESKGKITFVSQVHDTQENTGSANTQDFHL